MGRRLVFNANDVKGFSPPQSHGDWVSRMLIDDKSVGARSLSVNQFAIKAGTGTGRGRHPEPFDEVYYVLRGAGVVHLGEPPESFSLEPDTVVFIPAGTEHSVDNTGDEELVLLTVMPGPMVEGANAVYDGRIQAWGTSFKLVTGEE